MQGSEAQNGHDGGAGEQQQQQQQQGGSSSNGQKSGGASSSSHATQRSRTACVNCRTTKQKCDGPTRIPCRRCELYNLECTYSEASGRGAKRKAAEEAAVSDAPIPKPATVTSEVAQQILERLEELAARTRTIEETLRLTPHTNGGSSRVTTIEAYSSGLPDSLANASVSRTGNPVSAIAETFKEIDDTYPSIQEVNDYSGYPSSPLSPDAVSRGLITVEQAQRYFAFFVDRCRYWVHGFLPQQFQDPMAIRARSPLLFGSVCCTASFFLDAPNGEAGLQLYLSLVSLVNETLAPIIMSPRSTELDDEFILGIALSIIWKSPRIERTGMNVTNFQRMQTLAKLNNSTTYFLAGINSRAARVNKLNLTPHAFMKGDKTPKTVARVRLWLWMCFVDAHGCMQNGRAPSIDITDALKVTRTMAAIGDHPTDIELAALLETASVYRSFHGQSEDDKTSLQALVRANAELDSITTYWFTKYPRLNFEGAFVTQFIAPFNRLVINADVYRSWSARNQAVLESNGTSYAPPVLGHEEAKYLAKAIDAAQTILLNLSLAARGENGRRVGHFEEPQYWKDGMPIYAPLEPDGDHARHIRTAVDTVICVIIVFSAMFLAKLRAANLMRCNLEAVTATNPIRSWDAEAQGQVALYSKFFRIIELASDFLEMVAPNPGHPSLTQSRVLRSLLATATNRVVKVENHGLTMIGQEMSQHQGNMTMGGQNMMPIQQQHQQHQQSQQPSLPNYPHTLIGQQTVDHSPNSPIAAATDYLQQTQQPNMMTQLDPSLNDMLNGIGQPGNPLVPSFLGGDEWSMLMSSLGLKPS